MNNEQKLIAVIASALLGLIISLSFGIAKNEEANRKEAWDEGYAAFELEIPANANPYLTSNKRVWLDGWIAAKRNKGK